VSLAELVGSNTLPEIEVQLSDQDTYENFASFWQRQHPVAFAAAGKDVKVGTVLYEQPGGKPAAPYAVDAQVFEAFTKFVLDPEASGFQPRTRFDKVLAQLSSAMQEQGLGELAAKTKELTEMSKKDVREQLLQHREPISERLQEVLLTRVEPEPVRLARALEYDKAVAAAKRVALDPALYSSYLEPGVVINGVPAQGQQAKP
jgi:hypothetical protein